MVILELEMKAVGLICRRLRCAQLSRRLQLFFRRRCLPVLALTRTPGGSHLEWMSACCDPLLEYCERSVWLIGMFCFLLVLVGISTVVYTFYVYMVPFMHTTYSRPVFVIYFIYGHYLLINICFHYFKGVYTKPGHAPVIPDFHPDERQLKLGWKVCRKCDGPKPPRAHHCRICGRCVLKMDHHCPWMFNCIGHHNHRYFMSFVFFMLLGVMFVVNCTWSRAYDALHLDKSFMSGVVDIVGLRGSVEMAQQIPVDSRTNETWLVILVFFVGFGVTVALLMLGGWNAFLISRAETAIEFYTNQRDAKESRRLGKRFVNPYNHGFRRNWMLFLGFTGFKSFIKRVVLPSAHQPLEDGVEWTRCDNKEKNVNGFSRTSDV